MEKSLCSALCCLLFLLLLPGCQSAAQKKAGVIGYDIDALPQNLDPQFATEASERLIIGNIFEGLLTRDGDGRLINGVAGSFETSPNGLTLTFTLKPDAKWANGERVTADDFVFAFRRLFNPEAPSPFAGEYSAILNAREILTGGKNPSSLGVVAKSRNELEIRLAEKSPYFPANLAETPAMPCNEEFFSNSRGRYGLERDFVNANGPYTLGKWDGESGISLEPGQNYATGFKAAHPVNLTISAQSDKLTRLTDGTADIAELSSEESVPLLGVGYTALKVDKQVWCIVFNTDSELWGNPLFRQALSLSVDRSAIRDRLPPECAVTESIMPMDTVLAYEPYREYVNASPVPFDPGRAARLLEAGALPAGAEGALSDTVIIPEDPENTDVVNALQQGWQRYLSAYINIESLPPDDVYRRIAEKDYGMALVPVVLAAPDCGSVFSMFMGRAPSGGSYSGDVNPIFDEAVGQIAGAESLRQAAEAAGRAESMLLYDAVAIPVFSENTFITAAPGVTGYATAKFPSQVKFQYIEKQ